MFNRFLHCSWLPCGVPSMRSVRLWLAGLLLGQDLLDGVDSRPLGSASSQYDSNSYKKYGVEKVRKFPKHVRYTVHTEYTKPPIPEIERSEEGKFILDKDSDEGGFTSPRRLPRGITSRRAWQEWYGGRSAAEGGWTAAVSGIESGVYHVKRGTTHIHPKHHHPPRHSLRSEYSGTSTYEIPDNKIKPPVIYENSSVARNPFLTPPMYHQTRSPEFGRHLIPVSPSAAPLLSPKRRLRSSSPGPLSTQWQQLAQLASFNDVSSVRQPSSVERSFPSTVLSSFHNQFTPLHHMSIEAQAPYIHFSGHPHITHELPALTPLYRHPSRQFHIVGAQVHTPPSRFYNQSAAYPYYLPPPRYFSPWSAYPQPAFNRSFHWMSPQQASLMRGHAFHGSGRHIHHTPPPNREIMDQLDHSFMSDRHYVNIPTLRSNQRTTRRDPRHHHLLKPTPPPPPSLNQKPLATSSPPHQRFRNQPVHYPRVKAKNIDQLYSESIKSKKRALPAIPAKDSDVIKRRTRHHSAPDLSTSTKFNYTSKRKPNYGHSKRMSDPKTRSHEVSFDLSHELFQDQSPDSSSGFGSKNTSHQQSSSQSGQSLSALGLDTSRISEASLKNYTKSNDWEVQKIEPQIWPPPRLPPSYEQWLARQMQPQFRVPSVSFEYPVNFKGDFVQPLLSDERTDIRTPLGKNAVHPSSEANEIDNEVFISDSLADNNNTPITANNNNMAMLDISVDNHYEFDTLLSPTPIDETLMPGSLEWSGSNNNYRRLSDSELYGTGSTLSERRRMSQESMEERVAAMKREFLEYRRRQARQKTEPPLESTC